MRVINQLSPNQLEKRRILVRGDLDVPVTDGQVVDDYRLQQLLPTIHFLLQSKAAIVLTGHLDRPNGRVVPTLSLRPVAERIRELGGFPVTWAPDCVGEEVQELSKKLQLGEALVLENLRFHPQEEANEDVFARQLSQGADLYVNECFSTSHRVHASFVGIPKYLPSYGGLQLAREVEVLTGIRDRPQRPLIFILGGAKVETKVPLVRVLSSLADFILLGGKLMFVRELEGVPGVVFPVDAVRVDDIGPRTIELFKDHIAKAGTVVWNGPLGRFEEEGFAKGTQAIARAVVDSAAVSLVGGGDTVEALGKFHLLDRVKFISTGGGAMLEFLAKGTLPGIEALR